jgi:Putative prokaryotic signal transducing protein
MQETRFLLLVPDKQESSFYAENTARRRYSFGWRGGRAVRHAERMPRQTVVVAQVTSTLEAQLIVGMLGSSGIEAVTSVDDAGGQEPQWQLTQGVRVLVHREDEDGARRLIAEAENSES